MTTDFPAAFLPIALVAVVALLTPAGSRRSPLVTGFLYAGLLYLVATYGYWRVTQTLFDGRGLSISGGLILLVFAIEALSWFDAGLLFFQLARRTDRHAEADRHEKRLRGLALTDLPSVDVLIATYNEPLDVLERTILGALSIEWPEERLKVFVLDDGRRDWLREYCTYHGVGYLTRGDNLHAKAGNINAALKRTDSEFFLILDADFVPQRGILFRMAGFFEDATVGIVQIPHTFFNSDPMQNNLALHQTLPSDQTFFFDEIMRGRDGWDCAFCCGSNSLTRRQAMAAVGGQLPSGSITEDMLLTMTLLRKGYVTRYLCEPLAIGLAPETLDAFFVQRSRWAQGAMQLLYLREGPLGPGLTLCQRLMFMPTHWLTQSLMQITTLLLPAAYLLFGFMPMVNTSVASLIAYQFPAILATILTLRRLAPRSYYPLPATVLATLQSFRLLPTILLTLVKPHGHKFKVTPKGSDATGRDYDPFTVRMTVSILLATALGFALNGLTGRSLAGTTDVFPIVSFWSAMNGFVLGLVLTTAVARPVPRKEERFLIDDLVEIRLQDGGRVSAQATDASLTGLCLNTGPLAVVPGDWVLVSFYGVGLLLGEVRWRRGPEIGLRICYPDRATRDRMICHLFTENRVASGSAMDVTGLSWGMFATIFADTGRVQASQTDLPQSPPPADILAWHARELPAAAWDDVRSSDDFMPPVQARAG